MLTEPTVSISADANSNVVHSKAGRIQFYKRLMRLIEADQLNQIEERIRIHPLVQCHSDPENCLNTSHIKVRWYDTLFWTDDDIKNVE